jgi:purine-nucleoside phosphorylase
MNNNEDMVQSVRDVSTWIESKIGKFNPTISIIIGSGLSSSIPELSKKTSIPYSKIPHFPKTTVKGHKGELIFGEFSEQRLVIMQGRFHFYEGHSMSFISFPIRVMNRLGSRNLILTSAVGSLKPQIKQGDFVILKDQVNFMGTNPLIGNYNETFGRMFPDMNEPFSPVFRKEALRCCGKIGIRAREGVYFAVTGPSYETSSEVQMYRKLGGDVVGMSVVPEVISARQLNMNVLGICWISNFASGISQKILEHHDVLKLGGKISVKMREFFKLMLNSKVWNQE